MPLLPPIRKGQRLDAGFFSRVIDSLNFLLNLTVGPGLQLTRGSGGWSLWVDQQEGGGGGAASERCTGGVLKALAYVQGDDDTDSWTRITEDCPVTLRVITDIAYNATDGTVNGIPAHTMGYRSRLLEFDRCGKLAYISAEGDVVEIAEAETC